MQRGALRADLGALLATRFALCQQGCVRLRPSARGMPPPTPGNPLVSPGMFVASPGGGGEHGRGGMWGADMPTPPTSGAMCGIGCNINANPEVRVLMLVLELVCRAGCFLLQRRLEIFRRYMREYFSCFCVPVPRSFGLAAESENGRRQHRARKAADVHGAGSQGLVVVFMTR